jgi:RNase P/RNase MRP subunit p29
MANERKMKSSLIGKRVQVPAYTDTWMKGDRYGKVVNVTMHRENNTPYAHVMMDKSNRTIKFVADDCEPINGD